MWNYGFRFRISLISNLISSHGWVWMWLTSTMDAAVNDRLLDTVNTPSQANSTSTISSWNRSFRECSRQTWRSCGSETLQKGPGTSLQCWNFFICVQKQIKIISCGCEWSQMAGHTERASDKQLSVWWFDNRILRNQVIVLRFRQVPLDFFNAHGRRWGCAALGRLGGGQNLRKKKKKIL